jgi:hypothetical protein
MQATRLYIERYGKPVAFYSDKHTVFHVNKRSGVGGNGMTHTPAAKGRVDRFLPRDI